MPANFCLVCKKICSKIRIYFLRTQALMFLVNASAGSISLAPQHHVLCRLAAADTLVRDVLLLQRNAAGTYAGNFLDLVLAGFVTAPHCFYKTVALFFQSLGDLRMKRKLVSK